jgi:hypothetical protein
LRWIRSLKGFQFALGIVEELLKPQEIGVSGAAPVTSLANGSDAVSVLLIECDGVHGSRGRTLLPLAPTQLLLRIGH